MFFNFLSGRKLDFEKVIFSDFVLREQNARAQCARHQWDCVQNCYDRVRRMDRAARLRVNQDESEGSVSAEAPPWQGSIKNSTTTILKA